jgi:membrane protein
MAVTRIRYVLDNPWRFVKQVIAGFTANQGFLLSGAVAYYTLLTIVPMFALILVALSQIQEVQPLLDTLRDYLVLIAPNHVDALSSQITAFMENWKAVGITGILFLLFFSSFAFTSLENAMSVIFFHRVAVQRRKFLISAIIPYCYIVSLAVGMLLLSFVSAGLHSLDSGSITLLGRHLSFSGVESISLYLLGVIGEILLLTSTYMVMPVGRLSLRHAFIGGVTAALLWELTRHFLLWYFSTLSLVNIVYGAFASVIIILLSLEAAAIILLLGAQVIAEYERIGTSLPAAHGLQT